MRPRKRVLLYCADPEQTAVLRLVLDTWGYAVTATCRFCDAEECAGETWGVFLVGEPDTASHAGALDQLFKVWGAAQEVPVPALLYTQRMPHHTHASRVVLERDGMAALRDALKMAASRKRGPKPVCRAEVTPREGETKPELRVTLQPGETGNGGAQVHPGMAAGAA